MVQGFIQFSTRGESVRLDVDELNERMAAKGRLRLRHSMKPDEGYGMVFAFDGVICNTHAVKEDAWRSVAAARSALPRFRAHHAWCCGSTLEMYTARCRKPCSPAWHAQQACRCCGSMRGVAAALWRCMPHAVASRVHWRGVQAVLTGVTRAAGLPFPTIPRRQMYNMSAERAAMDVLLWTRDIKEARSIADQVTAEYARRFRADVPAVEGVLAWLQALEAARVPCALACSLDRWAAN